RMPRAEWSNRECRVSEEQGAWSWEQVRACGERGEGERRGLTRALARAAPILLPLTPPPAVPPARREARGAALPRRAPSLAARCARLQSMAASDRARLRAAGRHVRSQTPR